MPNVYLLKKDFQLADLTGVLKERFQELKFAVSEYVSLKIQEHDSEHNVKITGFESNYKNQLNELQQRKMLFEEEFDDKIDTCLQQLEQFKKDHIDSNKSICHPSLLKNFESPSFDDTSGSMSIGERSNLFNFGKIDLLNSSFEFLIQV